MIPLAELLRIIKTAVLVWECVSPCVYYCCCSKAQHQDEEEEPQPNRRCALFASKKKQEHKEEEGAEAELKGCLPASRNRLRKRRPVQQTESEEQDQQPHPISSRQQEEGQQDAQNKRCLPFPSKKKSRAEA